MLLISPAIDHSCRPRETLQLHSCSLKKSSRSGFCSFLSSIKVKARLFISCVTATNVKRLFKFKSKLGLTEFIYFMNVLPSQFQSIEYSSGNSISGRQPPVKKKTSLQYGFSLQIKHQWRSKIKITI